MTTTTTPIKVKLVADNDVEMEVSREACDRINTIKGMIEDVGDGTPIQLQVSEPILREVIEYAEYRVLHPVDPKFLERKVGPMDEYDASRFADVANNLFTVGSATNALGTKHPRGYIENPPRVADPLGVVRPAHYPLNLEFLAVTANYLDFPELLMGVARSIAGRLAGKEVQTIRNEWNIVNDLTKEEEDTIRNEMAWFGSDREMPAVPTIAEIQKQVEATHSDLRRYETQRNDALKEK